MTGINLEKLTNSNKEEKPTFYKKYKDYYREYQKKYPSAKKHEIKQRFIDSFPSYQAYLEYSKENNRKAREKKKQNIEEAKLENLNINTRLLRYTNPKKYIYTYLKNNARLRNKEFNLKLSDIVIPEYCPILGIKLEFGEKALHDGSPSVDRIDNNKGYVSGNIIIISHKANRMKNNSSIEDIEKLYNFYKFKIHDYLKELL